MSQNLINQVPREKITTASQGFWKLLVLDIAFLASVVLISYTYKLYLEGSAAMGALLGIIALFLILSVFEMLFIKSMSRRVLMIVLESLAFLLFFMDTGLRTLLISFGIVLIFSLWGEFAARGEMGASFKVRFFSLAHAQMSKMLTALLITGIVLYVPHQTAQKLFLSESAYRNLFGVSVQVVHSIYPEVNLQSNIKTFSESLALLQLKQTQVYRDLPQDQRSQALSSATDQIMATLRKALGMELNPSDTLQGITYRIIIQKFGTWQKDLGDKFSLFWGIVVFFLIRGIGSIFGLIATSAGFAFYQLLLSTGAATIRGESRMQEVVEFD